MERINGIPQIGYGTWNREGDAAYRGTLDALEVGYRHIDTAEGYGNEREVGRAILASGLPRAEVFLTTKVAPESFGPGQIRPHVDASLEKLGVDRVDLLLLHYPSIGDEYPMEDYVGQFAEVFDAGLADRIGVSNFTIRHIDRARALLRDRPLATNQVELHPFLANDPIVSHCEGLGIPLTAYSPLARGAVLEDPVIREIAEARGATPAQVTLAYLMARGFVVIPSAGARERIAENLGALGVSLSDREVARIRALDRNERQVDGPWCPAWDEKEAA